MRKLQRLRFNCKHQVPPSPRGQRRARLCELLESRDLLAADTLFRDFVVFGKADVAIEKDVKIVGGFVGSDGELVVKQNADLEGLFADRDIEIEKDSIIHGPLRSNQEIQLKKSVHVQGDIDAGEDVKIEANSTILGNVTSAGDVEMHSSVIVGGAITEFGSPIPYSSITLPVVTSFMVDTGRDVEAREDETLSLSPGSYGKLKLEKNSTLNLTGGEYYFQEFEAKNNLRLNLNVGEDDIHIFVRDDVKFDKNLTVDVVGGLASDVYLETHKAFELQADSEWWGTVFAPSGDIKLDKNVHLSGALYSGRQINIEDDVQIRFVLADFLADEREPPIISAGLTNDTGIPGDGITSDPTIAGSVFDASAVAELRLSVPNVSETEFNITADMDPNDGSFFLDRTRLESILGTQLVDDTYTFQFVAKDVLDNVSTPYEISAILDTQVAAPAITTLQDDTGASDSDGITNDNLLVFRGTAEAGSQVSVRNATLGNVGEAITDVAGHWAVTLDAPLADGPHSVWAVATDLAGNASPSSSTRQVIVDTTPPSNTTVGLHPNSDTGAPGDAETALAVVDLTGATDPGAAVELLQTGNRAVADAGGRFRLADVTLEPGRQTYHLRVVDLAGNTATIGFEITSNHASLRISEAARFLTQATIPLELGQEGGTRTVRFEVDAAFDTTDGRPAVEDTLLVYLVDPFDPSVTLIDRGEPGTALFALSGNAADYRSGLVNFDGQAVEIDVTSLGALSQASLLVQLINSDADEGTVVTLGSITNTVDPDDVINPDFRRTTFVDKPAGPLDLAGLTATADVDLEFNNIRVDAQTGRYQAELTLRNTGTEFGRQVAVLFPGLPAGVTLAGASGTDAAGVPYVNMFHGILPGGLATGQASSPVLVEFQNPALVRFALTPRVLVSGPNAAPTIHPIDPIVVFPGGHSETDLSATDSDGDAVSFSVKANGDLPTGKLKADGTLIFTPTPDEVGTYDFQVVATDGPAQATLPVSVTVSRDPITTTRISGIVLNTQSQPLAGVPVELGVDQTVTRADGTFTLELTASLDPADALLVRGEAVPGPDTYPFIAEKLPLLLGHNGFANVDNVVARPIYLPALDVDSGSVIDPSVDVTVTTPAIPGASVFVAAGTLKDPLGNPFTGTLSITEVPVDLTPAALPENLFPDVVVTIQPGEMVFTTPAPLSLPNLTGFLPGTTMDLWSINPITGLFDNVGTGQVSTDGSVIDTIRGGIRNSSWHFFNSEGPSANDPDKDPRNQDKQCDDDCEQRDAPNSDARPVVGAGPGSGERSQGPPHATDSSPGNEANPNPPKDASDHGRDLNNDPCRGATDCPGPPLRPRAPAEDAPEKTPHRPSRPPRMTFRSDMFDPRPRPATENSRVSNNPPATSAASGHRAGRPPETEIALHSGAVYKGHRLAPYESLGVWRGVALHYDSERADPRPIIHTGFSDVANSLPEINLVSKLAVKRGNFTHEVAGYPGDETGRLTGGEHFFDVPEGATTLDVSLQADLRSLPSGLYTFESTNRFTIAASQSGGTAATTTSDGFIHVNTLQSPFGAGWGLSGLLEIFENPDGSVLMVDGSGGENLFKAPATAGGSYDSPPGDFSTLEKMPDGSFLRTHTDQTIEAFHVSGKLAQVRDRNGNQTRFLYDAAGNLERIIDPVGLETIFRYNGGHVSEIEDPAGRITRFTFNRGNLIQIQDPDATTRQFQYDNQHRLIAEVDKRGHREAIGYDFAGRVTEVTRKDGSLVEYSPVQTKGLRRPDRTSQPTDLALAPVMGAEAIARHVDANGNVTRTTLDKQGQLAEATDGAGRLPEVQRHDENLVHQFADGRGNITLFEYDDRGNVTSISDPVSRGASSAPLFPDIIYSVDRGPVQIVTADVNSDGFADAITANWSGDSISVLLGNGGGGFGFRTDYSVNDPRSVQLVDVDADSIKDLVTANRNGSVSVLVGNPDGTFGPAANFAAGVNPNFVQGADLNADGQVDLVVADEGADTVSVLLGHGDGTFGGPTAFAVGSAPASLSVGDLNNDGWADVVTANYFSNDVSLLLGNGDGTFAPEIRLPIGTSVDSIVVADVTGQGALDIIATRGVANIYVLAGHNDGTFDLPVPYALTGTTGSAVSPPYNSKLAVADIDADGDLDLAVTEGRDAVSVLTNDGKGTFAVRDSFGVVDGTVSVASADLTLDGALDLVVLGNDSRSILGVFGRGDGTFVHPSPRQPDIAIGDRPVALQTADLNHDGHADVVTANRNDGTVTVLLGAGDGTLTPAGTYAAGAATRYAGAGDLDGDGNLDLVTTNYASDQLSVLMGDGTGAFAAPWALPAGAGPVELVLADLDRDDDLDIVSVGNRNGVSQFSVFLNEGDGTFAPGVHSSSGFVAATVDVGDVNGDGILDLAVGHAASAFTNRVDIRLGNGDGSFQAGTVWAFGGSGFFPGPPSQVKLVDATGDGLLDIVGTDPSTNSVRVRPGRGDGTFDPVAVYAVAASPSSVDVGHIDGDGVLDLLVANQGSARATVLLGQGDGTFADRNDFALGSAPSWIGLVDLNEDGHLDFVATNRDSDQLSVRLNTAQFAAHSARTAEYDAVFSQPTRTVDEQGRQVLFEIDPASGNILSITQVVGTVGGDDDLVTRYTYTPEGQIDTTTDPLGRVTDTDYDPLGRMERITYAAGTADEAFELFEYDLAGNLTARVDELGHRTQYQYDELNRVRKIIEADPDGPGPLPAPVTTYRYDAHGNLEVITDALQNTRRYVYDEQHRVVEALDTLNQSLLYTYDESGNMASVVDRLGRKTEFAYDDRNRLVETTNAEGGRERRFYDLDNNVIKIVDENANPTSFVFDSRNRLIRTINAIDGVFSFEYDRVNNLTAVTDELGRRSVMTYDEIDREITRRLPDPDKDGLDTSPTMHYAYDKASNLRFSTDAMGNTTELRYDQRDRLVEQVHPDPDDTGPLLSPVTRFTYDDANRLTHVRDPLSRMTTYLYDDLDRLIVQTYPDPDGTGPEMTPVITYTYDAEDNKLSTTDALGNVTQYAYDDLYRMTQIIEEDPDGAGPESSPITLFVYDAEDQLLSVSDPLRRVTNYEYDDLGRLVRETYPDPDKSGPAPSPVMVYTYDSVGNELSRTDALGNATHHEYDNIYRRVRLIEEDPDGAGPESPPISSYVYDAAHQLITAIDPRGRATSYEYDDLGRVVRETHPDPDGPAGPADSPTISYTYDTMSNLLSMTDALGNRTQYAYDDLYRLSEVIQEDPDGAGPQTNPTTSFAYDVASQMIRETDPRGRTTTYEYDGLGRVVREIDPDPDGVGPLPAPERTYVYDLMNNELAMTDAVGNLTQYEYDNLYRLTSLIEEDPDGAGPLDHPVTTYTYDVASQIRTETDPLGRATSYEYDDLGRLIRLIQPDPDGAGPLAAPEINYTYDLMNNELSMADPLGRVTRFEYDNLYRLSRQIEEDLDGAGPLEHPATTYTYDLVDNLLSLTDPVGNTTSFDYDDLDRAITETIELGAGNLKSRRFQYDLMNNLVQSTDRNDRVIQYDYDRIYRLVEERWLDDTSAVVNLMQFDFDEAGQMLRAEDVTTGSRYDYTYDDLNRITQTVVSNGGPAIVFQSEYDAQSRRTEHSAVVDGLADFRNIYAYDGLNRLARFDQVSQPGGAAVTPKHFDFQYNADDQLTRVRRSQEGAGGPANLVVQSTYGYDGIGRLTDMTHANQLSTIVDYDWTFDVASRITHFVSSVDGTSAYEYDNGDQLTHGSHDVQTDESYDYDENGNRASTGYSTGFYNRLNSDGTYTYEYDAEGNRTRRTEMATGAVTEYVWDHRNRLIAVIDRASVGGAATQEVRHAYDVFNRWIRKSVDPDGSGPAAPETTRYEYDANQIILQLDDSGSVTHRYAWGPLVDQILADERIGGEVLYPLADHLGTVRDLVTADGLVANHIIYDSFGNITSETDTALDHLFGFTGRPVDRSTDLQNNLNRWYDPSPGRWISEDPIRFKAGDSNVYRYVGNAPLGALDPTGLVELTATNLSHALPYAHLSENAYATAGMDKGTMVGDYVVMDVIEGDAGYKAVWFENVKTGEGVLAFAGTETPPIAEGLIDFVSSSVRAAAHGLGGTPPEQLPTDLFKSWHDWITDAHQGAGDISAQYGQAVEDVALLKNVYGDNFTVTGHSLGGGLATVASLVYGVRAITFNPAGPHKNTLRHFGGDAARANELIDVFRLWADPLTALQDRLGFMPDTAGTIHSIPTKDNSVDFWLKNHGISRLTETIEALIANNPTRQMPTGKSC